MRDERGWRVKSFSIARLIGLLLAGCDYGALSGADKTGVLGPDDPDSAADYESLMKSMSTVWYSHYAGIGRLDGYRIGKWKNFDSVMGGKTALLPDLHEARETYVGGAPGGEDFFLFYDSSVYGQQDDGDAITPPAQNFGFLGIVRAVNIFNGDKDRGAIIIEYMKGAAPTWDPDIKNGQLPFFGIYYRVLSKNTMQLANAVDLAAMAKGKKYYTEKKTLDEAIAANTVENEAEYVSWGVVIPQDREP
jgi:hypothetical protein